MSAPAKPPPLDRRALATRLREEATHHLDGAARTAYVAIQLLDVGLDLNAENAMRAHIAYTRTAAKVFLMLRQELLRAAEEAGHDVIQ